MALPEWTAHDFMSLWTKKKTSGYPHDVEPIPEKRTFISDERHTHYRKWQATSCPGFTSRKMGVSTRHRSTA